MTTTKAAHTAELKMSSAHIEQAAREGWGLFATGMASEGHTPLEIQRDDEAELFDSDDAVYAHVIAQAEKGSECHLRALAELWADENMADEDRAATKAHANGRPANHPGATQ